MALQPTAPRLGTWRYYPWLLGLLLAPILFGSVNPECQAVVGSLLAVSLLLLSGEIGSSTSELSTRPWRLLGWVLLILPLLPLPAGLLALLSPARFALAQSFPVEIADQATWIPLTVSLASTIQRLWELSLLIAGFWLARQSANLPGFPLISTCIIGAGIVFESAADFWYRLSDHRSVLGLWEISWGQAAGTFANRNHFADWLYLSLLFFLGWVLRSHKPLRSARPASSRLDVPRRSSGLLNLIVVVLGLVAAIASGSRGGLVGFLAGLALWVVLLQHRSRSRTRWIGVGVVGLAVFVLMLLAGDYLLHRLASTKLDIAGRYPKLEIWKETFGILFKFPMFGSGWGSFATIFNHFKSIDGGKTFWHAENDYVQFLLETGLTGLAVFGFLANRWVRMAAALVWRMPLREPELVFGASAALLAFAVHAQVEFVFQITATSLLAATMLGWITGCHDQVRRPAAPSPLSNARILLNVMCAVALLAASLCQGVAFWQWTRARDTAKKLSLPTRIDYVRKSLRLWPWAMDRQIGMARLVVQKTEPSANRTDLAAEVRGQLNRAIAWDPLNWDLRLDRVVLDLDFSTNSTRTIAEVGELIRLNPLQSQIPIYLARHVAPRNPELAIEFLRALDLSDPRVLHDALSIAWQAEESTALLWSLTPNSTAGFVTLGDFAVEQKLFPLAVHAYDQLINRLDAILLAKRFLQAQEPGKAIRLLVNSSNSSKAKLLLARAYWQASDYPQAIRFAESFWLGTPWRGRILTAAAINSSREALLKEWQAQPKSNEVALQLGESIFHQAPAGRDLNLLRRLASQFPDELRLAWLAFTTQVQLLQFKDAAQTALDLANRVAALD